MNAYKSLLDESSNLREDRKRKINERKSKLQALFQQESSSYEKELKDLRINGVDNSKTIDTLKYKIDSIKSAREEDRKKLAEEKLYQHWRENNPDIREIESKRKSSFMSLALSDL